MTRSFRDLRHRLLWEWARNGHRRAFQRLYRELSGPVLRYVTSRLGPGDDAEDVASEVFRKWITHFEQYDPRRGSLEAWLIRMARNCMIDHLRRRRPTEDLERVTAMLADASPDPLARLIDDEEARFVHGLLASHPAQVREMFSLHFAHGLSYRDIATTLGLSEAAVKQRFARTLRDLRQRLDVRSGDTPAANGTQRGAAARNEPAGFEQPGYEG